jgi:hypothetical protein
VALVHQPGQRPREEGCHLVALDVQVRAVAVGAGPGRQSQADRRGLAIHVVLDNLSVHKAPEIQKWLAHKDRRRWHLHFTPTSSSWTNLVERWLKELTDRMLRRGVFTSVPELETAILDGAAQWNSDPKPFVWKAAAEDITEKVQRGRAALTRQITSTTDH